RRRGLNWRLPSVNAQTFPIPPDRCRPYTKLTSNFAVTDFSYLFFPITHIESPPQALRRFHRHSLNSGIPKPPNPGVRARLLLLPASRYEVQILKCQSIEAASSIYRKPVPEWYAASPSSVWSLTLTPR